MLDQTRKSFDKIRARLLKQQQKVEIDLKNITQDDADMNQGLAETSEPGIDSWMADIHNRAVSAKNNLKDLLEKTKTALAKMRTGKYGKCENCGKPIEIDRLEAMPTATLCIKCSKKPAK